MRASVRLFGLVLCALVLVGMGVHYASAQGDRWPYPDGTSLNESYGEYVGEETFLFGTVQETDARNATAEILVETDRGQLPLTVGGVDATVQPGGVIQVYGTVEPDRRLAAENVVVVNPAGSSNLFKYAVSLVGALLVVALFFRHWRFDFDELGFEAR